MCTGKLFVLSAPSGTGKTTILKKVMAEVEGLKFSISHTTRCPRQGEQDGVDYHFVTKDDFKAAIEKGNFLEWAEVHSNFYGTSSEAIEQQLKKGIDVVLDIDVQGADIIRSRDDVEAIDLFIAPPSLKELERRLRGRGTEQEDAILTRLKNARVEMHSAKKYQYLIINDEIDIAAQSLKAIVLAERAKGHRHSNGLPITIEI